MSDSSIEELKKKFFIDKATYAKEYLKGDLEGVMRYSRITEDGSVSITSPKLTDKRKIGVVLAARFVANKLDQKIPEVVTAEEIATYARIDKAIVNARAKELIDEGYASREKPGQYKANTGRIQDLLESIK